jgi:hypothetical protein
LCGRTKWLPNANPIISSLITLEKTMSPLGASPIIFPLKKILTWKNPCGHLMLGQIFILY